MKESYRVLIVEDEEIESSALTMMLKYNRPDVGEIRCAASGIKALEIYREFQPEIVLMDINLPGVNGLDVIRQMRLLPGSAYFVIISAHSQFSYAQEAMRLDVQDFLVKPICLEDINRVLDSLTKEIDESRSQSERAAFQQAKIDAIRPVLESDCVLSIASMRSSTPIATIFDFMQIPVVSGFVFTIRGEGIGGPLLREIKSRMRNMRLCCIGEVINEICVCIALSDENLKTSQIREIMAYFSHALLSEGRACQIGVGSVANSADDLRRSYEQAVAASRAAVAEGSSLAFHAEKRSEEKSSALPKVSEISSQIVKAIRLGRHDEVISCVQSFFQSFELSVSYRTMQDTAYWLYVMVIGHFTQQDNGFRPLSSQQIFAIQDMNALRDALVKSFLSLVEKQETVTEDPQDNQLVSRAIQIVRQRFQEDITLVNVSEELNVSLFYLSKLFRKHTGTNFTEYLTKLRVDHAKKLLAGGEMSIKEVAYAAGFNSQSYFSKIFKKYTGIAPSEYTE